MKAVNKKSKRKLNPKIKKLFLVEFLIFFILFAFILYCQIFVAKNPLKSCFKYAFGILIPLLIYAVPTGISFLIRGQLFTGDFESPLKDDDSHNLHSGDRNYNVANLTFH